MDKISSSGDLMSGHALHRSISPVPARGRGHRRSWGFTMAEMLIVLAIMAMVIAIGIPFFMRFVRRENLRAPVREVHSIVLAARMQAAKRNQQVIVLFDLPSHRVTSWADNLPYNYIHDVAEPLLADFHVPDNVVFRAAPNGGAVNDADAVAFDTYLGNNTRVDMIVFRPDGTSLPPQAANSVRPVLPGSPPGSGYTATVPAGSVNCAAGCRGIYMADNNSTGDSPNRNVFRISVDDSGSTGRVTLLKWLPSSEGGNPGEVNFVPSPWRWNNGS
ncbi:MAG: prepilin-type N-terminal cleavage/methylation domain-containing protein [Acidobacteria bacterium]|nr:prepilin-type N-terminal cleavage/methylation domain-containing protein [Acidobacteriota bacterium]MCA1609479.1 prepilin-type N-terminal cleavage/methylation domain-containing protein [Acidobacteriota bacterium]